MPKDKKCSNNKTGNLLHHAPLGQVIQDDVNRTKFATVCVSRNYKSNNNEKAEEDTLDEKTSRRIFDLSRKQQLEEAKAEHFDKRNTEHKSSRFVQKEEISDDDEDDDEESLASSGSMEEQLVQHDHGYVTVAEGAPGLSAEEEAVVAAMMGDNNGEVRRTLADIIMEKIREKEMQQQGITVEDDDNEINQLPPKVVEVYTDIGKILSRYTSGKLPKAFKVIPSLTNWEEVLYLTRPDMWTPQAMFAATRIFASNLNPKMAQRFYKLVLLDSVRADIMTEKKLNYHYYMSLKKAIYKPAAFFKGILLPLCKENCTLREAAIVASVLQRVSIPVHHSAVAIHKLSQLEYSGATSIFIKTLLNKKYSLPAPVIGSLVCHFSSFTTDERTLPVLWHQSLLVFVQRYKNEVKDTEAREALRLVMKQHYHPKITPEIRRELFGIQAWEEERTNTTTPTSIALATPTAMETTSV